MLPLPQTSTGSNRLNSSGTPKATGASRNGTIITTVIQPGTTFALPNSGSNFYFILATAPLACRPSNGSWNTYSQGTGLRADEENYFTILEVRNDATVAVVFSLFIGFGGYIDNRLITSGDIIQNILFPTYDGVTAGANNVAIPDRAGQQFLDSNGLLWLAVERRALQIFNNSTGVTIQLKNDAGTQNVALVFPQTGITLPMAGDFRITPPSANVDGIVSEIYAAVQPSIINPIS
jgi:hypothetical protein